MNNEKDTVLMKNNMMIKAKYNLNAIENKFFQLILFNFQKQKIDNNTTIAEIPINKFKEISNKNDYKTIAGIDNILSKLMDGTIYFKDSEGWGKSKFIYNFKFIKNDNKVRIKVDSEIYKMLFDYLKGYTPVNLAIFFGFKSYYSQRMYELLRLWSNSKTIINYSIDELRELLMLKDKYELYKDFKRRVIIPSVKELNEKSLMQIEIKEIKTGRKVTSINFIVTDLDKRKYFEKNKNPSQDYKEKKQFKNQAKRLKFNNFDQREYDYDSLEKQLLGWDKD